MRLDGDDGMIGMRNVSKLIGVFVISCCAVLVCTMFLNFYLDVRSVEGGITSEILMVFYNAQVSTAKVVCLVSGGCLLVTSVVILMFYIKHYIDTHRKELGILKALDYSNFHVAKNFWVFGISALGGTTIGFGGAFLLMPRFYALQNEENLLPELAVHFHPIVLLSFVVLPTLFFMVLSIGYAWCQLRRPVLLLLKEGLPAVRKPPKGKMGKDRGLSFIGDLKKNTLKSKKTLVFFIVFASFCFSAMTQMSFSMNDLSSEMMGR